MHDKCWSEDVSGRDHLEGLLVGGKIQYISELCPANMLFVCEVDSCGS